MGSGHCTALLFTDEHLRPLVGVLGVAQPAMLLLLVGELARVSRRQQLLEVSRLVARRPIQHLKRIRRLHPLILHRLHMLQLGARVGLPSQTARVLNELLHNGLIDSLLAMVCITPMVCGGLRLRIFHLRMTLVLLHHLLLFSLVKL